MPLQIGIIGPPYSGKSTIFAALTGQGLEGQEHLGLDQPAMGVAKLLDRRLDQLVRLYSSKKTVYESLDLLDFAPFMADQGRHNDRAGRILGQIRQCQVLLIVLRGFQNPATPAFGGRIDPQADLELLLDDLTLADLELVLKRIEKLEKSVTKPTPKQEQDKRELALQRRCLEALEQGQQLSQITTNPEESKLLRSFGFLTDKPAFVVVNISESDIGKPMELDLRLNVKSQMPISAKLEAELLEMEQADREMFMTDLGVEHLASQDLPAAMVEASARIQFFTASETEARAWLIACECCAAEAAGKIHTDMARGFIRAETISVEQLIACGSEKEARHQGKIRAEGKAYQVKDGDVIVFRFSV